MNRLRKAIKIWRALYRRFPGETDHGAGEEGEEIRKRTKEGEVEYGEGIGPKIEGNGDRIDGGIYLKMKLP